MRKELTQILSESAMDEEFPDPMHFVHQLAFDVFGPNDVERILSKNSRPERLSEFLKIVRTKGDETFRTIVKIFYNNKFAIADNLASAGQKFYAGNIPLPSAVEESSTPPDDQVMLAPSSESIAINEEFYKHLPSGIMAPTQGVLENLHVECVDSRTRPAQFDLENVYRCFSQPKGLVLVLNNRKFRTLPERIGTDVDAKNISQLFQNLGYKVKTEHNLSAKKMLLAVDDFALKPEHRMCDSAVVVILSHGQEGAVFGCDGAMVPISSLISKLDAGNCPNLRHKPKLFFIQACRGEMKDTGQDVFDAPEFIMAQLEDVEDVVQMSAKIPTTADILLAYATTPGFVSWRNSLKGSWFIQAVCQVFAENAARLDIQTMLTRVNRVVANSFLSSDGGYKQLPEPSNRLLKDFYFFPGYFE